MGTSFSPRFISANVSFWFKDIQYPVGQHLINTTGVPGFAWTQFDPIKTIGTTARVVVDVLGVTPWQFSCPARFTCEQTGGATLLGLSFEMLENDRRHLEATIAVEGTYPDYVRKFPRLHYMEHVAVFPARTIIRFFYGQEDIAVSCDIENISPQGLQVYSEDYRTAVLLPDSLARIVIQPRGPFLRPIPLNASVKRVISTVDPKTQNTRRFLGLAFTAMSSEVKSDYADLLKQIVTRARDLPKAA